MHTNQHSIEFRIKIRLSLLSIEPTFPKVRRILAHICQIKWNLISFDDGNDKKTLNKHSYTENKFENLLVNDSWPIRPVW